MDDNILRLESVEFEDWGARRICGKLDVDQRTFIYGADKDAHREILKTIRWGRNLTEMAFLTHDANPVAARRARGAK